MRIFHYLFLVLIFTAFSCTGEKSTGSEPGEKDSGLVIAVAANVQFAMNEIEAAFEASSGIPLEVVISSSGKLTAQIQQGAPYAVFLSADMKYPQALYDNGFAADLPKGYAYGALVLWTMKKDLVLTPGLSFLTQPGVRKIAVANPRIAPYGEQTIRLLEHYGWYDQIKDKLIFGESIAQTNQYITTQACEVGFTAKSVVLSPEMNDKGSWIEMDPKAYDPIEQGVVITRHGQQNQPEACRAFFDFLFSETARAIFERYGYVLPKLPI